jgi:hypothetical protein
MYTIFYAFQLGTDLAKVHFGQIITKLKCVGFYMGVLHHHDTSLQDNDGTTKAFSYPSGMCIVAPESVKCIFCKKTGVFGPKFTEKSPFSHIMMIGTFCWLVCPLNEGNDGHFLCSCSLTIALIQVI